MLVFLVTGISAGERTTTSTNIINSYNTYNSQYAPSSPRVDYTNYRYTKKYQYDYLDDDYDDVRYLRYSHTVKHEREEGLFGNQINRYGVYVRNRDYIGGYFTVKFYFYDYRGKKISESITHYIRPNEERVFFYQSIYDKYYYDWDYEVIPRTRV